MTPLFAAVAALGLLWGGFDFSVGSGGNAGWDGHQVSDHGRRAIRTYFAFWLKVSAKEAKAGFENFIKHRCPSNGALNDKYAVVVQFADQFVKYSPIIIIKNDRKFPSDLSRIDRPSTLDLAVRVDWDSSKINGFILPRGKNTGIRFDFDPLSGTLTNVGDFYLHRGEHSPKAIYEGVLDRNVGAGLSTSHFARNSDGSVCGLSGFLRFGDCEVRRVRSPLVFGAIRAGGFQSSPDEKDASASEGRFNNGNKDHPKSVVGSILCRISGSLATIIIGWNFLISGFKRGGDALDLVLDGNKIARFRVFGWMIFALSGAVIIAGTCGYWISLHGHY